MLDKAMLVNVIGEKHPELDINKVELNEKGQYCEK